MYFLDMEDQDRLLVSILSGCDYLTNLRGFGFGSIVYYFTLEFQDYLLERDELDDGEKFLFKKMKAAINRAKKMNDSILPYSIEKFTQYK